MRQFRQAIRQIAQSVWPLLVVILMLGTVILASGVYVRTENFNSDDLTTIDFCDDILAGANLVGWHLPGAPYLAPDLLLLLPCRLLFADLARLFLAYAILFHTFSALGLFWLGVEAGLARRAAWNTAFLGITLLLAVNLAPGYSERTVELIHPGSHVGAIPAGLFFTAFILRCLRQGFTLRSSLIAVGLGSLAAFSDRLFVLQFLLPASLVLFSLWLLRLLRLRQLLLFALLIGSMVLGMEIIRWAFLAYGFRFYGLNTYWAISTPAELKHHILTLWQKTHQQHVLYLLVVHFIIVGLVAAFVQYRRSNKAGTLGLAAALILVLSGMTGIIPVFIMGKVSTDGFERYMYTLSILPPLLIFLFWRLMVAENVPNLSRAAQFALVGFSLYQMTAAVKEFGLPRFRQPYPPLAQLLDELARNHGCRRGLAGHWEARRLHYLTQEKVHILPALHHGEPFFHASNPDAFLSPQRNDLHSPDYQFIIVNKNANAPWPEADAVRVEFGEPKRAVDLGTQAIWIYDKLEGHHFRRFLDSLVARRCERKMPCVAPSSPKVLARPQDGLRSQLDAGAAMEVARGSDVEIAFDSAVQGNILDFSADHSACYDVTFYRADQPLGTVRVPPMGWTGGWFDHYGLTGVRSRLLALPASVQNQQWTRAVARHLGPNPTSTLAHFLIYEGATCYLDAVDPNSLPPRRFEAELAPSADPQLSKVADPQASGGQARFGDRTGGIYLLYGPHISLPPGRYRVDFSVKVDTIDSPEPLFICDIVEGGKRLLAQKVVSADKFSAANRYQTFSLTINSELELANIEFRLLTLGHSCVWVDYVDLVPLP